MQLNRICGEGEAPTQARSLSPLLTLTQIKRLGPPHAAKPAQGQVAKGDSVASSPHSAHIPTTGGNRHSKVDAKPEGAEGESKSAGPIKAPRRELAGQNFSAWLKAACRNDLAHKLWWFAVIQNLGMAHCTPDNGHEADDDAVNFRGSVRKFAGRAGDNHVIDNT
jgi:hypothetical protein